MKKFSATYKQLIAVFFLAAYGNVYFSYFHHAIDILLERPHEHTFSLYKTVLHNAGNVSDTHQKNNSSGNGSRHYFSSRTFPVFFSLVKPEVPELSVLKILKTDMLKCTVPFFVFLKTFSIKHVVNCHSPPVMVTDIRMLLHSFLI